jgi:hypothetical protein
LSASRKSAGSSCTTPPESAFLAIRRFYETWEGTTICVMSNAALAGNLRESSFRRPSRRHSRIAKMASKSRCSQRRIIRRVHALRPDCRTA